MLKSAIAALAVSGAALLSTVMATPSFAATTNEPLVIGPQVTITVSCPKDRHAVDHSGLLSCARDRKHHKAKREDKAAPRPATKPAAPTVPTQWTQALGPWHHCWLHHSWPYNSWRNASANTWL